MDETRLISSTSDLSDAQESLIQGLTGTAGARIALQAAPGTGKSRTAIAAIDRLMASHADTRALVVLPVRLLAEQYRLRLAVPNTEAFSSARFRELYLSGVFHQAGPLVVFLSRNLLGDLTASTILANSRWNLIVLDESQGLTSKQYQAIWKIADDHTSVLALSFSPPPASTDGDWTSIVRWKYHSNDESGALSEPRRKLVLYERSDDESAMLDRLAPVISRLVSSLKPGDRTRLLVARESSFYALEEELSSIAHDMRATRNQLAHTKSNALPEDFVALAKASRTLEELQHALSEVDLISTDSKVTFAADLVERLVAINPTVVFVASNPSAVYIDSVLRQEGVSTVVVDRGQQRGYNFAIGSLRHALIVPDDALGAYDLSSYAVGVHFDLPSPLGLLHDRDYRLGTYETRREVELLALVDGRQIGQDPQLANRLAALGYDHIE